MRTLTAAVLGLAMMTGVATSASADCDKQINLTPSAAGIAIAARGKARVRARLAKGQQDLRVEMDAQVPNGTTFMVFANGQPVGTITINFFVGTLVVTTDGGMTLPAGADPVCSIGSVIITDGAGATVLSGSF